MKVSSLSQKISVFADYPGMLKTLGRIGILAAMIFVSGIFIEKGYISYEVYTQEKDKIEHAIKDVHKAILAQKKILSAPELQSWLQTLPSPFDHSSFESWLRELSHQKHCRLDQLSFQKTAKHTTRGSMTLSSVSDADVMDLIDRMMKNAHNSLVIQSCIIERTKDFSEDVLENITHPESREFLFSSAIEFVVLHNYSPVGTGQVAPIDHAQIP